LLPLRWALAAALLAAFACRPAAPAPTPPIRLAWLFDPGQPGAIAANPVVADGRVYLASIRDRYLAAPRGAVLAVDRRSRRVHWSFDDGGEMLHTISTPALAHGRLYVGEGMHGNLSCRLYCLDAATGRRLWAYRAGGHIESAPCVAGGLVCFGAGDDGVIALDAVSGKRRWHWAGGIHVDTRPAVAAGRLFAGSGVSRLYRRTEAFCLDTATGRLRWRQATDLPVWGSPVVAGERVLFGLGNGRLVSSALPPEKPAGALLCLDVRDGREVWRHRTGDVVCARPAVDGSHVYFTSRDGACYCLEVDSGRLVWRRSLGSPAVTTPAVDGGRVYAVAIAGQVRCLDAATGAVLWAYDVTPQGAGTAQMLSSPVVVWENGRRQVLFGAEVRGERSSALLYCLEETDPVGGPPG
jgi:outer membrane protein assembly factor BamB